MLKRMKKTYNYLIILNWCVWGNRSMQKSDKSSILDIFLHSQQKRKYLDDITDFILKPKTNVQDLRLYSI